MANWKVSGRFEIELEDIVTESHAYAEAMRQLIELLVDYPADQTLLDIKVEQIQPLRLEVRDTLNAEQVRSTAKFLISDPCECEESQFLCYPENGACTCGTWKHHVHCKKCGGISQWG